MISLCPHLILLSLHRTILSTAYFTFVATDPVTKKPVKIPPLQPETDVEKLQFEAGKRRAQAKKAARKNRKTLDQEVDVQAKKLLAEAGPLLNMPSLADPNSILMNATQLQNAEMAQPQLRNLANRIFGGFLMRRAFELAYACSYLFGGARPRFLEVDEVSFQAPVDVGDLTVFNARVLYTHMIQDGSSMDFQPIDGMKNVPLVTIEVEAWIAEPEERNAKLSNQFYFTFALPSDTVVRKVLPSSMDEARRMVKRIQADDAHRKNERMK